LPKLEVFKSFILIHFAVLVIGLRVPSNALSPHLRRFIHCHNCEERYDIICAFCVDYYR
jgi:hypothetical protein